LGFGELKSSLQNACEKNCDPKTLFYIANIDFYDDFSMEITYLLKKIVGNGKNTGRNTHLISLF
jgi:hypothetical protein